MKTKAKIKGKGSSLRISMYIGHFNEEKFKGYNLSFTTKKYRAIAIARVRLKQKGHVYLMVWYNKEDTNSGIYYNITMFKRALHEFTDINLIRYINKK